MKETLHNHKISTGSDIFLLPCKGRILNKGEILMKEPRVIFWSSLLLVVLSSWMPTLVLNLSIQSQRLAQLKRTVWILNFFAAHIHSFLRVILWHTVQFIWEAMYLHCTLLVTPKVLYGHIVWGETAKGSYWYPLDWSLNLYKIGVFTPFYLWIQKHNHIDFASYECQMNYALKKID